MDERRTLAQMKKIRAAQERVPGIRLLAGIEVDILKDGKLDLDNEVLAQLDVVVASVHSYMKLERAEMTERLLAAIENPYAQIIAHPTGRLVMRREAFEYDMEKIFDACRQSRRGHGVQRLSRPARPEGCSFARRQAARRENRHFHRCSPRQSARLHAIWRAHRAPRLD